MQKVDRQVRTSSDQHNGSLEVYDRNGKMLKKSWRSRRKGFGGDSKILVRFTSPPEVKGVGLLIIGHGRGPSDQWLYTPAIKRERRIAPQDRSVRFLGTDFSYEDMELRDVDDSEYQLVGAEKLENQDCYKIKAIPKLETKSQYSYFYVWVNRDNFTLAMAEFYKNNELAKIMAYRSLERIQDVWTARELEMKDVKRGSRTVIRLADVEYNRPFSDDLFTLRALREEF
ncbi:MAG TPA: outer membrane lipoprotein-sorting protein [Acidobacteriota bacterium]|jgi:hypothetical protein